MDKKAWIVVSTCIALLGLQWYWTNEQRKEAEAAAPTATAQAAESAPTAAPAEGAAPAETAPTAETATPAEAPTAAVEEKPTVIASLTGKQSDGTAVARYDFQDLGGSVHGVTMLGKAINSTKPDLQDDVVINSDAQHGIGALIFNLSEAAAPRFDTTRYSVVPAQTDDTHVTLVGKAGDLIIRKVYSLMPLQKGEEVIDGNAYALSLKVDVQNTAGTAQKAENWGLYTGAMAPLSKYENDYYNYYVRLENNSFEKENKGSFNPWLGRPKERILETDAKDLEWLGTMNQFYATIVQADKSCATKTYYAAPFKFNRPAGDEAQGLATALGIPAFTLAPKADGLQGGQQSLSYSIFTGPKLNLMLNDMTGEFRKLDRVMDYTFLTPISYAMNWLINKFYLLFGNWGWAIVAMTFVVRLCIWPLYRKSYYSMKQMSLLQPKMQELKEKYGDDQQKIQMEMMNLYREYNINPMAGCLPMMLQMPIFLAFFWVLQTAAEFRGAPWLGWVTDLSQMDTVAEVSLMGYDLPINVLPVIMAFSMLFMMRMTPTPATADNMQVKIMRWMPLMFFFFCYTYGSALALYWTTTNIISIIQTLIIRRMPAPELKKAARKKGGKKSFFEKMMEAQKAQQALLEKQQREAAMRNVTKH